ncbi:hypothetical protein ACXYTJ_03745 [Gilvimarinus sp. F26214L]|uniref:hypothetical protein n=1 Tax=Gilvimarinus sp. DZF01 TaxID=3461371 RepID=UPI004045A09E
MVRFTVGAFLLAGAMGLSAAECIEVTSQDYELEKNDIGSAMVHWKAGLKNKCRTTMDADLTIQLVNARGESVYELVEKTTLGVEEALDLEKEVYVPSRITAEVEDLEIQVQERQRQP